MTAIAPTDRVADSVVKPVEQLGTRQLSAGERGEIQRHGGSVATSRLILATGGRPVGPNPHRLSVPILLFEDVTAAHSGALRPGQRTTAEAEAATAC